MNETFFDGGAAVAIIVAFLMFVAGFTLSRVRSAAKQYAAPIQAKDADDRTLIEKGILEAERRLQMLDIQQLEIFLRTYVAANIDDVLQKVPVLGPIATASKHVDTALNEFQNRNPDLAKRMKMTVRQMQGKLAGTIGDETKDVLADALRQAISQGKVQATALTKPYSVLDEQTKL